MPDIFAKGKLAEAEQFWRFWRMKGLILCMALCGEVHAELLAYVATTQGTITVALQHERAPQAVANFICLAQGTRRHISPRTGVVTNEPYYTGEKFFRVVNSPGFRIAQTGSGTGTNSGSPGYVFRDEFHPSLTHVPYVLSMANSGINTNGSQIFFTGNATIPSLDNVHTIFGLITDAPSRAVIDPIHAAGNDGSSITGITFSRTDPVAQAFDEQAQNLAVCTDVSGQLTATLGIETAYQLTNPLPASTTFQVYRSENLVSWTKLPDVYQDYNQVGASTRPTLDTATAPRAFYHIAAARYTDALAPSSMANRTLVIGLFANETLTFQFNATGVTGTATYVPQNPAGTIITPITDSLYTPSPYGGTWIFQTNAFNLLRFYGGLNATNGGLTTGTNKSEQYRNGGWVTLSNGSLSLTR